jgi:hypothetical protein
MSAAGAIQKRFEETWQAGVDELLTKQGAVAAALALDEGLEEDRAEKAARAHVRALLPVKVHLKGELKLWLQDGGPRRAVAQAKANQKGN